MCLAHDRRVDDGVEEPVDLVSLLHRRRVDLANRRHIVVDKWREGLVGGRQRLGVGPHIGEETAARQETNVETTETHSCFSLRHNNN